MPSSPGLWPLPKRTLLVSLGVLVGRTLHIYQRRAPAENTHMRRRGVFWKPDVAHAALSRETPKGGRMAEAGSRDGTRANGRRKGGPPRLYLAAEGRGDVTLRFAQRITHNCCSPVLINGHSPSTLVCMFAVIKYGGRTKHYY